MPLQLLFQTVHSWGFSFHWLLRKGILVLVLICSTPILFFSSFKILSGWDVRVPKTVIRVDGPNRFLISWGSGPMKMFETKKMFAVHSGLSWWFSVAVADQYFARLHQRRSRHVICITTQSGRYPRITSTVSTNPTISYRDSFCIFHAFFVLLTSALTFKRNSWMN